MTLSKEQRQLAGLEPVQQSMFLSSGSLRVARPGAKEVNETSRYLQRLDVGAKQDVLLQLKQEFPDWSEVDIKWAINTRTSKMSGDARKIKQRYKELKRPVKEHKTPGLVSQLELIQFKEREAFSISRPIPIPKYDDPLHDGYTEDEVLSEARKGFSRLNAMQIGRRVRLSKGGELQEARSKKIIGAVTTYLGSSYGIKKGQEVRIVAVMKANDPESYCRDDWELTRAGGIAREDRVEIQPWIEKEKRFSFVTSDPKASELAMFKSLRK